MPAFPSQFPSSELNSLKNSTVPQQQQQQMGYNWADLLEELLVDIAQRIPLLEDFVAFGGVCKSWRSVATKQNFKGSQQVPWLMLSEEDETEEERRFFSLTKGGMVHRYTLPEAKGKRIFESLGWFVTLSEDGEMSLLHPFSRLQIPLPHIHTFEHYEIGEMASNTIFVQKAVLSSIPDHSLDEKDFVVMVIYGGCSWLGFWRPGDKTWTTIETRIGAFYDVNYINGKFYGVDAGGTIFCCDIGGPNETVAQVVGSIPTEFVMFKRSYVVECEGDLMIVVRGGCQLNFLGDYGSDPNNDPDNIDESRTDYGTEDFRLFVVDLTNGGGWTEKKSLGNNALFLGDNASITVQASKFPGINANCIYYTDDCWESYIFFKRGGGKDMGIYNLEDGSWMPHYKRESFSRVCPPLWVNPSL